MKRKIYVVLAVFLCVVAICVLLAACNDGTQNNTEQPGDGNPPSETPVDPGTETPGTGNEPGVDDPNDPSDPSTEAPDDKKTYTLHYTASVGGYILAKDGTISGSVLQEVTEGDNGMRVTAVANTGYEFVRWSDGVTTATRTDSNVTSDITVTAEFRRIELTLTYTAGTGGSITGETSQTVLYGESGTAVTAVPEEGYVFVRWSDGVTTATRTDSNVTSDITVTAEFRLAGNTTDFAGGNGTAEYPYEVATFKHLRNMELYPDAHYVLTADIVLPEAGEGGSNFAPLFSDKGMFGGTLDGQGHKIVNLTVYNTETFYSGLFSCISASGSVTNLTLENASVSGTNYIGGIAGYALGAVTDCTVSGSITYIGTNSNKVFAGGIAGRAEASVDGCVTDVTITIEDAHAETNVGGIVGYLSYGGSEDPMTLSASGSITASSSDTVSAGGLIGCSSGGLYLSASYATGNVTSTGGSISSYAGGLVGYGGSTVTDSYATGDVTSTSNNSYAGGLVGSGDSTVTSSYATGDVTSTGNGSDSYAGGLVGKGGDITITDSYATGSVTIQNGWYSYAGGLIGYDIHDLTITDSYATGNVTSSSWGTDSYAGGLVGYGINGTITDSYATGNVASSSGETDSYAGGLVGYDIKGTITDSYATGSVTIQDGWYSYAGGLIGRGNNDTITDSYATGSVTIQDGWYSYAGGLVGYGYNDLTVRNSYSVSCVNSEGGSNIYIGGLGGYTNVSLTLENAHWYGGDGTAAEYAVGYSNSLGIPTSIGSTRHNSVEEFYTLADVLNAGREEPVWEHTGVNTLPTLIAKSN